jgi:hypothetical protein
MGNVRRQSYIIAAIVLILAHLGSAASVAASPNYAHAHPLSVSVAPPPFAATVTWHGFVSYWKGFVHRSDRVVLAVGLVAATALFIITRGRWLK